MHGTKFRGWAAIQPAMAVEDVGMWCRFPYPGHPKGCPNYGRRPQCPPIAKPLWQVMDPAQQACWFVWYAFPLKEHVAKMREKHPDWSDRQLRNCLYWQGTARRRLREVLRELYIMHPAGATLTLMIPEAHGVDVCATMARVGIRLDWPPTTYAYKVALVGRPRMSKEASDDD